MRCIDARICHDDSSSTSLSGITNINWKRDRTQGTSTTYDFENGTNGETGTAMEEVIVGTTDG